MELGVCWTGYQAWLPSWLTRKPPFWTGYQRAGIQVGIHANQGFPIGTHGPGTQAGTQGKPCFAGAENLSKPDIQNLKKPETQDAAKPNKTLHTLLAPGLRKTWSSVGLERLCSDWQ